MSTLEVKALALQLCTAIEGLEKRIDHAARQSLQATQALDQQSRQMLETSGQLTQQAVTQIRQGAGQAIAEGVGDAMQNIERIMREGTKQFEQALVQLELRLQQVRQLNTSHAWKTLIASAVASLAVITVAVYASSHTHADIKRYEWVQQINAAVEAGHLAPCPEGGLCVQVNNKWVRVGSK